MVTMFTKIKIKTKVLIQGTGVVQKPVLALLFLGQNLANLSVCFPDFHWFSRVIFSLMTFLYNEHTNISTAFNLILEYFLDVKDSSIASTQNLIHRLKKHIYHCKINKFIVPNGI